MATSDQNLAAAAQAAADALNADSNYCANVGINGSAVNSAVHAFKVAWNANVSSGGDMSGLNVGQLPYNGQYDADTANAMIAAGFASIPNACTAGGGGSGGNSGGGGNGGSGGGGPITPSPTPGPLASSNLPTWAWWVIGGIVVLGGAAIWWMMKHGKKRGVRRHHSRETAKKRPPLGSVRVTLPRKARGTVKRRRK